MVLTNLHLLAKNNNAVWLKLINNLGVNKFIEDVVLKCSKKDSIIVTEIVERVADAIPEE